MDLRSGFWQLKVRKEDRRKTAFCTDSGHYRFVRMSYGLAGAPSTYQRLICQVLKGLTPMQLIIYVDDILLFGKDPQDLLHKTEVVLNRLRAANFRIHPAKCKWGTDRILFLGYCFDSSGISTDSKKTDIIRDWPRPRNPKAVRSFVGCLSLYRKFIKRVQ